jgi:hypothetical protein
MVNACAGKDSNIAAAQPIQGTKRITHHSFFYRGAMLALLQQLG